MGDPVTLVVVGAGSRGFESYAPFALSAPTEARVVAVVEPDPHRRARAASTHLIPTERQFSSWQELAALPKLADAAIIATPDREHAEPAIALMNRGYNLLLEKPMAPTEEECRAIIESARVNNRIVAVCHVLRYTEYFRRLREVVRSGALGTIATVRHFEQVEFWHQAHSYVRGNWANSKTSAPMILAKSCHDMDMLLFLLGRRCTSVSSFGRLSHFRAEHRPKEATERCVDCPLAESRCPYSATKFYLSRLRTHGYIWPVSVIAREGTRDAVLDALKTGPYGRCVYSCDNDVVDHQVVALEFEGGISASFTMTAFTGTGGRLTEIFGSHGEVRGDGEKIIVTDFASGLKREIVVQSGEDNVKGGHMGGDLQIMRDFVNAVRSQSSEALVSTPLESLESHIMAFAAERARVNGTVEKIRV